MAKKHVPLRTCVLCQQVRPKRDLVRVVRTPEGPVVVDERGKGPGRGAYLCRNRDCWEKAIARDRLDHALKAKLTLEDEQRLLQYGQRLPAAQGQGAEEQRPAQKRLDDSAGRRRAESPHPGLSTADGDCRSTANGERSM
jgi:predicted RNA-binding protein YlxR (DUF448 family)